LYRRRTSFGDAALAGWGDEHDANVTVMMPPPPPPRMDDLENASDTSLATANGIDQEEHFVIGQQLRMTDADTVVLQLTGKIKTLQRLLAVLCIVVSLILVWQICSAVIAIT
jgi:hypothetical protein